MRISLAVIVICAVAYSAAGYSFRPMIEGFKLQLQGKRQICANFPPEVADMMQKCRDLEIR